MLLWGAPPRCDPKCGQRVGAISSGASETVDHEMDGTFAGPPPRCDPNAVSGWGQHRLELPMTEDHEMDGCFC